MIVIELMFLLSEIQSQSIEQLSWDEFMVAYRMQSKKEGPFPWETPFLRTPGMVCLIDIHFYSYRSCSSLGIVKWHDVKLQMWGG